MTNRRDQSDMDLVFRETEQADIQGLFEIRARTRENPLSKEQLASLGITPESIVQAMAIGQVKGWVCLQESHLVGFCNGDRSGEILVLAVLPEYEHRGIGTTLLARVVDWLRSLAADTIWLAASSDRNSRAHGLYRSLGWRPSGEMDDNDDEILVLDGSFAPLLMGKCDDQ
jgi:ribosomal protein S18 acetylase RimI-like enzyme